MHLSFKLGLHRTPLTLSFLATCRAHRFLSRLLLEKEAANPISARPLGGQATSPRQTYGKLGICCRSAPQSSAQPSRHVVHVGVQPFWDSPRNSAWLLQPGSDVGPVLMLPDPYWLSWICSHTSKGLKLCNAWGTGSHPAGWNDFVQTDTHLIHTKTTGHDRD